MKIGVDSPLPLNPLNLIQGQGSRSKRDNKLVDA